MDKNVFVRCWLARAIDRFVFFGRMRVTQVLCPSQFIRQITQTSIVPIARKGCAGSKTERRDELRSNGVVVKRESRLILGNTTFTVLTVILFNLFSNPSYSLQICSTSIKGIATARW